MLLTGFFLSCDETNEAGKYDYWQERNETFVDSLQRVYDAKTDPDLHYVIDQRDKSQRIFYKKIKSVDEGQPPYLTSEVRLFYRGMFIDETVFFTNPGEKFYTRLYGQLDVFDSNFKGDDPSEFDTPATFRVSGVITGWIEVLQWMKPGERWEVYIPWRSAYGASGLTAIPGYSTLIFDMELLEVVKY